MSQVRVPPNPNYVAEVVVLLTSLGAKRSELNAGRLACNLLEVKRAHRKVIDLNLDARGGKESGEELAIERLEARNGAVRSDDGELPLPQIYVDGFYVGDTGALQELEDDGLLGRMLRRQLCLHCHQKKASKAMTCPSCGTQYEEVLPGTMTIQEELRQHYATYGKEEMEDEDTDSGSEADERVTAYEAAAKLPPRPVKPPRWEQTKQAVKAKAAARLELTNFTNAVPEELAEEPATEQPHPDAWEDGADGNWEVVETNEVPTAAHPAESPADSPPPQEEPPRAAAAAPAAVAAPEAPAPEEAPAPKAPAPKAPAPKAPAPALAPKQLPVVRGYLWKKSPNQLRIMSLMSYEKRYFVLSNMQLFWWKTKQDAVADNENGASGKHCKGFINMTAGPVEVEPTLSNDSTFSLKPSGGTWAAGSIAKGDTGRAFTLDATDSEHRRDTWVSGLREHARRARQVSPKSADVVAADAGFYAAAGLPSPAGAARR
mmetsp:Transcript_50694/g.156954  ORF Transcript_50694/g.156954 Transcript_50694/m.156954 type:complete len:488 (+) Transcript_50694:113-1576(+)